MWSGGSATGGSGNSGGAPLAECLIHEECLAVADMSDPCFTPHCSFPVAASYADVAKNPCLVPWDERFNGPPADCSPPAFDINCHADCAMPPLCVSSTCEYSRCTLKTGYTDQECGTVSDCDALQQEFDAQVTLARLCSDRSACSGDITVPDACGCPTPTADADAAATANALWDQLLESCQLAVCLMPCVDTANLAAVCDSSGLCAWSEAMPY
jgi:hypothetical protein